MARLHFTSPGFRAAPDCLSPRVANDLPASRKQLRKTRSIFGAASAFRRRGQSEIITTTGRTNSMAVEDLRLESRPPLTVEEFAALAHAEGWDEDTRVELLDGEVVWMSPINDPHAACVRRLTHLFSGHYAAGQALVSVQNPIRIERYDEPQPDVALLRPREDFYARATPTPTDILLLVEVADTTLRTDLGRKARIYASGGVAEYWVIDLNNRVLYVHGSPADGRYTSQRVLGSSESISAAFADGVRFKVVELIG